MYQIEEFIQLLEFEFSSNSNSVVSQKQSDYMRNKFDFYGITAPQRRELQKPFLAKEYLPNKVEAFAIIKKLWLKPQREFHHFSQDFAFKYVKKNEVTDIDLYEFMIVTNSWWDTVDFIAVKLVGAYFKAFPEQIEHYTTKWIASKNFWLQRTALLFQLKYKSDINTQLLSATIQSLLGSKEFFINKAIGWVLREYSRTNPTWVLNFVEKTNLHPLSHREAIRLIKN